MLKRFQIMIIAVIVAIVAGTLAYIASISNKPSASSILSAVPSWAMRVGSPNAPMTLIEFFDPLCPYCAVAHYRVGSYIEQLVESGRLQLILIPLPLHGNYSQLLINHIYCAYKNGSNALKLLNAWYKAFVDYAVNKTEDEVVSVYNRLKAYQCNESLTVDQFAFMLQDFNNAGITVRGTPTFIVIKGGQVVVIEGARVEELKRVLE